MESRLPRQPSEEGYFYSNTNMTGSLQNKDYTDHLTAEEEAKTPGATAQQIFPLQKFPTS